MAQHVVELHVARLAELMVHYGVGVQPEATVTLFKLDEDFFEEL